MKPSRPKTALLVLAGLLIIVLGVVLVASRPGDASRSCQEYYAGRERPPSAALEWCEAGGYFSWRSTLWELQVRGQAQEVENHSSANARLNLQLSPMCG